MRTVQRQESMKIKEVVTAAKLLLGYLFVMLNIEQSREKWWLPDSHRWSCPVILTIKFNLFEGANRRLHENKNTYHTKKTFTLTYFISIINLVPNKWIIFLNKKAKSSNRYLYEFGLGFCIKSYSLRPKQGEQVILLEDRRHLRKGGATRDLTHAPLKDGFERLAFIASLFNCNSLTARVDSVRSRHEITHGLEAAMLVYVLVLTRQFVG